jgi:hypothetical protein
LAQQGTLQNTSIPNHYLMPNIPTSITDPSSPITTEELRRFQSDIMMNMSL